ncbi:MAG TPA: hypothetical protein VJH95_03395 [Candidatus Nanoarchaeia archaeon]|nr:hypothetical protein [Candidatus Nanoarchaeia archaeon]
MKRLEELTQIAQDGFGSGITQEDVRRHIENSGFVFVFESRKHEFARRNPFGFSAYSVLDVGGKKVLYLEGIVLRKEFQKCGIFGYVNRAELGLGCFDFFAMRTQNPVVYAAAEKLVDKLYPNGEQMPEEFRKVGRVIALGYLEMDDFAEENFVGRKTYGTSLYERIPRHGKADKLFDNVLKLDYNAGDSVLLIGKPRKEIVFKAPGGFVKTGW